ncbi:MAG: hypothetical protein R6X16_00630, partial [Anaerolineae bacterium]
DIAGVERLEGTLQQNLTDTEQAIKELAASRDLMLAHLDRLWEAEGRPGPGETAEAWAEGRVKAGIAGLSERLDGLRNVASVTALAISARTNLGSRNAALDNLRLELDDVDQQIAMAPSLSSATAVQLLDSLEKAKAYVEAEQALERCPTCLRPIDRDVLLATINAEFAQLDELKKLSDKRQGLQGSVAVAASLLDEARTGVTEALKKVQDVTQQTKVPEIAALGIAWPDWEDAALDTPSLVAICDQLQTAQASLELQRESAHRDVSLFNSLNELWTGVVNVHDRATELGGIHDGLRRAHDIVHEKRVAFTQGILDAIQQEANRLFQAIHPGENMGLEQLKMEEERRGSVSQTGTFHGHGSIPPQAIFSESHLDTLGFCVWLATAKREVPEETILLIDDIFSSVDATHLGRLMELLQREAPNFMQVIMATHFRLCWDRCQNAQGTQRVHLGRWDATNGIFPQNMPRVLAELRARVGEAVLDRQAISSKAGILLESTLDDLTLLYACSLPRRNVYTLGTLLNGSSKLFAKHRLTVMVNANWRATSHQPEAWQDTAASAAYDTVNRLQFIRNQVGCHFSAPGTEIPDSEVRDFGTATIALVEALTCPNCGMLATRPSNDGTYLRCSCSRRTIRMTPVAIP